MGKPQVITAPDLVAGVSIEYAKRSGALRLSGPVIAGGATLEIPFPKLLEQLDMEPAAQAGSVRYLLFGALHRETKRGAADVIGVFASEEAARRGFLELRQQRPDRDGWGELAKLDARGKLTRIAWFGITGGGRLRALAAPAAAPETATAVPRVRWSRRPWRRRGRPA